MLAMKEKAATDLFAAAFGFVAVPDGAAAPTTVPPPLVALTPGGSARLATGIDMVCDAVYARFVRAENLVATLDRFRGGKAYFGPGCFRRPGCPKATTVWSAFRAERTLIGTL